MNGGRGRTWVDYLPLPASSSSQFSRRSPSPPYGRVNASAQYFKRFRSPAILACVSLVLVYSLINWSRHGSPESLNNAFSDSYDSEDMGCHSINGICPPSSETNPNPSSNESTTTLAALFRPIDLGTLHLQHRVVMAPLTRYRAIEGREHIHSEMAVEYYAQRASTPGTLIIGEGTLISAAAGGQDCVPGIWSEDQVRAWKKVLNDLPFSITDPFPALDPRDFGNTYSLNRNLFYHR
jgi:hypothetical protein